MTDAVDKARKALQEALAKLPPEPGVANLTIEQLNFIIAETVSRELDSREAAVKRRRKERRDMFWTWLQRLGLIIAPLAGLAVLVGTCDLF